MTPALHTLLHQAIDYAGLFPPAALPMEDAAREFTDLRAGPYSWLMRRFVCPIHWLPELEPLLPTAGEPWTLSVLGTSLEGFRQDLNAIERFEESVGDRAWVEAYEVRATPDQLEPRALRTVADAGFDEVFIEVSWGDGMSESLATIAAAEGLGAKARTGGLEAAAFPSCSQLGAFVHECVSLELPFKLTAGLHHPLPRFDEGVQARMHGFLNVLFGSALVLSHDLSREELTRILDDSDPQAFWSRGNSLGYRDWDVSVAEIEIARALFTSWGSCSVLEPVEDLIELGHIEVAS